MEWVKGCTVPSTCSTQPLSSLRKDRSIPSQGQISLGKLKKLGLGVVERSRREMGEGEERMVSMHYVHKRISQRENLINKEHAELEPLKIVPQWRRSNRSVLSEGPEDSVLSTRGRCQPNNNHSVRASALSSRGRGASCFRSTLVASARVNLSAIAQTLSEGYITWILGRRNCVHVLNMWL